MHRVHICFATRGVYIFAILHVCMYTRNNAYPLPGMRKARPVPTVLAWPMPTTCHISAKGIFSTYNFSLFCRSSLAVPKCVHARLVPTCMCLLQLQIVEHLYLDTRVDTRITTFGSTCVLRHVYPNAFIDTRIATRVSTRVSRHASSTRILMLA